jgi:hypothetical protein
MSEHKHLNLSSERRGFALIMNRSFQTFAFSGGHTATYMIRLWSESLALAAQGHGQLAGAPTVLL